MKRRVYILLSIILLSLFAKAQDIEIKDWWNDLTVYQVNKMPPRTNVMPCDEDMYVRSLNSQWRFNYVKTPSDKIEGFYNVDFDSQRWMLMPVPGNWELNGFDVPVYVNVANEFKSNPPYAPTEYNPVGQYITEFKVPGEWEGRNVYINIGAVKSAMYLWVNGQFVGYSEDSKVATEFDITDFVQPGEKLELEGKILKREGNLTKLAIQGSLNGEAIISSRLTMESSDLDTSNPQQAFKQKQIINNFKEMYALLTQNTLNKKP